MWTWWGWLIVVLLTGSLFFLTHRASDELAAREQRLQRLEGALSEQRRELDRQRRELGRLRAKLDPTAPSGPTATVAARAGE